MLDLFFSFGLCLILLWSLLNFEVSIAIHCCIFVTYMVSTCLRIRSTQKTFGHLGKSEQINLWSKACIKSRFSFNFSISSRDFGKKRRLRRVNQFSFFNGNSAQTKRMAIAGRSSSTIKESFKFENYGEYLKISSLYRNT